MALDVQGKLSELFSLEGKLVLMTGAAGAIGGELSEGLAAVGAIMALCDINVQGLEAVERRIIDNGGSAASFIVDMMDVNSINSCVDKIIAAYGKIDVLINMAGINKREKVISASEESFDRIMGINLKGVHFMSQAVAKHMINEKNGSIINVASYNSVMMLGGCGLYGASKSGVAALTRAQAIELAEFGIRANAISPGHISTQLTAPLWNDPVRSKFLLDRIAMARPGKPSDLLGMTILLASDASSYMSGMLHHVDGGCLAGGQPWDI